MNYSPQPTDTDTLPEMAAMAAAFLEVTEAEIAVSLGGQWPRRAHEILSFPDQLVDSHIGTLLHDMLVICGWRCITTQLFFNCILVIRCDWMGVE